MNVFYKNRRIIGLLALIAATAAFLLTPTIGFGYPVPELPSDNLIQNPWFRLSAEPTKPGMDGWTPEYNQGVTWGLSQKVSNPSPDDITTGKCGASAEYCGTGARWAHDFEEGGSEKHPGVDVYIYQVVQADPNDRKLNFFMYFVNHRLEVGEAVISGAQSANGPWEQVWVPVSIFQDRNPGPEEGPGRNGNPWFNTPMVETVLADGYPFYKITLHARYPESDSNMGDVGIKITGVYFSVDDTDEPAMAATTWVVVNPTLAPSGETVSGGSTPVPQGTAGPATQPANTEAAVVEPTQTPGPIGTEPDPQATELAAAPPTERSRDVQSTGQTQPTQEPVETPDAPTEGNGLFIGFLAGLLGAGVLLIAVQMVRMVIRKG